ncbi:unnamed protein product [Porites lobata]|uniref:G-protein coupled receptors family 1 profile domain-containing protein n=1 Tax=Porites lobata TaxID=104759 RepID=A0ABN8NGY4_9CNID|nr:unnamed protein product [Porites lobata]
MIAAVNILFSITSSLGNILILIALRKVTSLHPPTKLLFQCLAITDLGVGVTSQPLFATVLLTDYRNVNWSLIGNYLSLIFCGVSMLISTALSVDRLLALLLGLRYRHVVTLKRVRIAVAGCWLTPLVTALVIFLTRGKIFPRMLTILIILSVIISVSSYTKIVLKLRQHQTSVQENVHQGMAKAGGVPINLEQYKRTVVSIALVQISLVACYVPFLIFLIGHLGDYSIPNYVFFLVSTTFVYLNSSLNPFLYCWRIKEVRQAVLGTIKRFCSCPS